MPYALDERIRNGNSGLVLSEFNDKGPKGSLSLA